MLNWLGGRGDDVGTLLAKRQYDKAIKHLEAELKQHPDSVLLRQQLADALERKGEKPRALEILFRLADELAEAGFVAKAMALLKKIQRIDPDARIDDRLARLVSELQPAPARPPMPPEPSRSSDSLPALTSELVLADTWLEDAEERDDFHWSPLFSGFSRDDVVELFGELRLLVKKPGSIVYTEGEPGASLFVLANGAVRVYRRDGDGRNRQLAVLRGGDFFGTRAVLEARARRHTVTAARECELLEIDRASFERIASRHPHVRDQVEKISREQDYA